MSGYRRVPDPPARMMPFMNFSFSCLLTRNLLEPHSTFHQPNTALRRLNELEITSQLKIRKPA